MYKFSEDMRETVSYLLDRTFSYEQLKEVYRDLLGKGFIEKENYADFDAWFIDQIKMSNILLEKEKR